MQLIRLSSPAEILVRYEAMCLYGSVYGDYAKTKMLVEPQDVGASAEEKEPEAA